MLRRRQINASAEGRGRRLLDAARWPFERVFWAVEERVVWPLRERGAGRAPSGRAAGVGALAAGGLAAILLAALLLPGGGSAPKREAAPVVAIAPPPAPPQEERPAKRALKGPPPKAFATGGVAAEPNGGDSEDISPAASGTGETGGGSPPEAGTSAAGAEAGASASARKPVPAGPAAMKVARRFSKAFLDYEIGRDREAATEVFDATAAPRLAEALSGRPPRLPENGKVPKAKVVNLVPGPRAGKAYTVSVSLLRVGLTSELRLEMRKQGKANWLVTDVRG